MANSVRVSVASEVPFGETYATHRREHFVELATQRGPSREDFTKAYLVSNAMKGSENRTTPEDTGAILRPTTIATIFMDPALSEPDLSKWFIWNATPKILPPLEAKASSSFGPLSLLV